MEYGMETLRKRVRVLMDENQVSTPLTDLGDSDALSLDEIIDSSLLRSARVLGKKAPVHLIDNGVSLLGTDSDGKSTLSISWRSAVGIGMGSILLPADFMRMLVFRMSDWDLPADIITDDDPLYAMQQSRYPGIRGCPQRPIGVVVNHVGHYSFEFYSCTAGESVFVREAYYLREPVVSAQNTLDISSKLLDAVVLHAAYLSSVTLGANENLLAHMKEQLADEL